MVDFLVNKNENTYPKVALTFQIKQFCYNLSYIYYNKSFLWRNLCWV